LGRIFEAFQEKKADDESLTTLLRGLDLLIDPKRTPSEDDLADAMEDCLQRLTTEDEIVFGELLPKPLKKFVFTCPNCRHQIAENKTLADPNSGQGKQHIVGLKSNNVLQNLSKKWNRLFCSSFDRCPKCQCQFQVNTCKLYLKLVAKNFTTTLPFGSGCTKGKDCQTHRRF
jgi:hypothetical protein